MSAGRGPGRACALVQLALVAIVYLVVSWPGAARRGVISEEVQPYLRHHPKVLDDRGRYLPPNDDPGVRRAIDEGTPVSPHWVGTPAWPEVAYLGRERSWPVFIRGHQTAIGTFVGIVTAPLLGGGIAGVRRSSVLMGLGLLVLVWELARRLELSRAWATCTALACALSPGLWFFCRTGYGFELASRVFMLAALVVVAKRAPLSGRRAAAGGALFALAVLCRATIAVTLAPPLLLMLFHPRRWTGPARPTVLLALGGGIPVLLVGLALATLPFAAGSAPAAALPLDALAVRTLAAPMFEVVQLAWVADARVVLAPLVGGHLAPTPGWLWPLAGSVVLALALLRWWDARAGEGERLFVAGLLGNTLGGAWLYGDPVQFQLGMALEPLFVLAVAHQLASLGAARPRWAIATGAGLGFARTLTLASLFASERQTDNPMLSGTAQRALVALLAQRSVRGDDLVTTAYDHVGVVEAWTDETLRPVHAWRPLRAAGVPAGQLDAHWERVLAAHPACHVLFSVGTNLAAGPFTDSFAVSASLERVLAARGGGVVGRSVIAGDGGKAVFELDDITPCQSAGERP